MKQSSTRAGSSPSRLIDQRIKDLGDWRGKLLAQIRAVVLSAVPDVIEEWKWRGVPVWYGQTGMLCTGESYKSHLKMTFFRGASLKDPSGLFNNGLDSRVRRSIDYHEGDKVNEKALKALVREADAFNASRARK